MPITTAPDYAPMLPAWRYVVRKQGRQWAIFHGDELIEGGFFSRENAETACAAYTSAAESRSEP
jgi:hypothetical protein